MNSKGWMAFLGSSIFLILGVFPSTLADRLKTGLNNANLRTAQYREIATAYSTLNYGVEGICQVYLEGIDLHMMNIGFAKEIVKSYNGAITQIRNNEYVYKDEVKKLWGKTFLFFDTDIAVIYDSLFRYVTAVDSAVHAMNWMGIRLQPLKADSNYVFTSKDGDSLCKQLFLVSQKIDSLHHLTARVLGRLE